MSSILTQPAPEAKMILTPMMTLESQKDVRCRSMAYAPDGKQMISVFQDKTIRKWDLQAGKKIEEVRDVCEGKLYRAVVSRDGRWVMTSSGEEYNIKELKGEISSIDISADGKLLASGSRNNSTVLVWGMDTGKLVAGPFESDDEVAAIRFSLDSKKLAVESYTKKCLEVWDVQTQKLDAQVGKKGRGFVTSAPIFWTKKGTILSVFNFDFGHNYSKPMTIYEFDASTLKTVGDPFQGHTDIIYRLALSFDYTLLASSSFNNIKLWFLETRQLLASFHVQNETVISNPIFSPDIRKLAYSVDHKIFICNIPPDILASIRLAPDAEAIANAPDNSTLNGLLNSDATRRANVRRKPATSRPITSLPPRPLQPLHTRGPQKPVFFRRLHNLLSFSPSLNVIPPLQNSQSRDPLDFPATSSRIHGHTPAADTTQGHSHLDPREYPQRTAALPTTLSSATAPMTLATRIQHLWHWWPAYANHQAAPIADVPLAQGLLRNAAAGAPRNDEDLIPDEYFDTSSQNCNSQQPSAAARIDTGEHGHGGSCFCF